MNYMPSREVLYSITTFAIAFAIAFTALYRKFVNKHLFLLRIRTKIITGFFLIAVIPVIVLGILSFRAAEQIIIDEKLNSLEAIADFKQGEIEVFFKSLERNIRASQDYYNVKTNLPIISENFKDFDNPNYLQAKEILDGQLRTLQQSMEFLDFILVNNEGLVVYTTENTHTPDDIGKPLIYDQTEGSPTFNPDKIEFSEIFRSDFADSGFEMLASAPVSDFDNQPIGHVIFAVDMGPVYDLIQDNTGLGKTGETLIGRKVEPHVGHAIGGHASDLDVPHVFFLNPLRYDPDAALKKTVVVGSDSAVSLQNAAQGQNGSGITEDYRGENVVSAWRYIPSLEWGMVAKIDAQEAFIPVKRIQLTVVVLSVALVLTAILFALILSLSITKPISRLSEITKEYQGENEEDVLSRLKNLNSHDEIGFFVDAYKKMIQRILTSKEVLKDKLDQLEKFRKLSVGRELKMMELKEQIKKLEDGKRGDKNEKK